MRSAKIPAATLVLAFACASEPITQPTITIASIVVTPLQDTLRAIGHTRRLVATAYDLDQVALVGVVFMWTSSAPSVLSIDSVGVATAVAGGKAVVTASAEGVKGSAAMVVQQVVTSLEVFSAPDTLAALGDTVRLVATAFDAMAHPVAGAVSWSTSDATVATVQGGLVTAVGNGSAFVRAVAPPIADSVRVAVRQVLDPARSVVAVAHARALPGDTILMQLEARDARDHPLSFGGATVTFAGEGGTSTGNFLPATDDGDGTYHGAFVAETIGTALTVAVTANGQAVTTLSPTLQVVGFTRIAVAGGNMGGGGVGMTSGGFTCGVITGGELYCWGISWFGIGGTGNVGTSEPNPTPTLVSGGHAWMDVAAGAYFVCALTTVGQGYCWGDGDLGQIGIGESGNPPDVTVPTAVHTDSMFAHVVIGNSSGPCALTAGSAALCWGSNAWGRLGNGSDTLVTEPTLVSGGIPFTALSTAFSGTCGVTTSGDAYCWGASTTLGLGNEPPPDTCAGLGGCAKIPSPVAGGLSYQPILADDGNVVCAVATTQQTYCWGSGYFGNGTIDFATFPIPSATGLAFVALEGGDGFLCGIIDGGSAYCWGDNTNGRLGNGTMANATTPVAVSGDRRFVQLAASQSHVCGIATDGNAFCWGGNDRGELGDGTVTSRAVPVRVRLFVP